MISKNVSGETRICGIIGDPIEHTMSPSMHNAAFQKKRINYVYVPFRVTKEGLSRAIEGMKALNIRGLNVTIPHKVAVIPLLDKLDPLAERLGAVNTIVNEGGVLTGYNTDAAGFVKALLEKGIEPRGKKIVILGAGGASRAVSFALAEGGAHLVVLNRLSGLSRAVELASSLSVIFKKEIKARKLDDENLADELAKADVLVNATSVGMTPAVDETPVAAHLLKPGLVVVDIVYNPIKTRLLTEAESAGASSIIDGVDMLVWQGALAFEKWTGSKAPAKLMREAVIKKLAEHEN